MIDRLLNPLPPEDLMQLANGIFLEQLWERVEEGEVDVSNTLQETALLAVKLSLPKGFKPSKKLHNTEPESIFLGESCHFADPDVLIFPIVKTGRNQFPRFVTFGRALVSDICLASPKISKMHGWFGTDAKSRNWAVTDHHSTNGIWLNGSKIKPGSAHPLRPNDELQIGDARGLFLDCMHLEALLSLFGSVCAEETKTA